MQDRANVSADFLDLMKQEIIEVIKKYIDIDENAMDVRLTNKDNGDGSNGAPALYANIPIKNIKNEARKINAKDVEESKAQKENGEASKDNENIEKAEEEDSKDIEEVEIEEIEEDVEEVEDNISKEK